MITKTLWSCIHKKGEVEFDLFTGDRYEYDESDIAIEIICAIIMTPFTIIFDIFLLPLEILYLIIKYFVIKHYDKKKGEDNE